MNSIQHHFPFQLPSPYHHNLNPKKRPTHFIISATPTPTPTPQALKHNPVQGLAHSLKAGKNIKTLTQFNHVLMGLVLNDELEYAYKLYSSLSNFDFCANGLTFSILVNYFCKKDDPMEAKKVLEHMISNGFMFDNNKVKTFTQVINSFCKKGKLKEAFQVFEMMGMVQCDANINTYNCLLKGLCYVGRVEEAYEMLLEVKKWLRLDVYSYTAVMDGFCKVGRSDEALELLNEAIEVGLSPSVASYNTVFNGYFKEGRPMEGFGLLERMKERNCVPDYVSYSTLLHGLLQWGEFRAGVVVFNEMLDLGFEVDDRMMNTLLRGVCRRSRDEKEFLENAYRVFDEMCKRGCDIDPCAYELMIEAFCNGNEMDKAYVNLCEMIRMGLSPRSFTLNIVIRGLCIEGKVEKAMSLLVLVCKGRGEMLDRVAFDVLIKAMNRQGMVKSAMCVYCVALKNGVIPLKKPRR